MRSSVVQLIHIDLRQNRPFWGTERKQPRIPLTKRSGGFHPILQSFLVRIQPYTAMFLQCTGSLRRALQIVYVWAKYSKLFGRKNHTRFGPFETTTYLWCCLASNARHEQHILRPCDALRQRTGICSISTCTKNQTNRYILRLFWTPFSQFFRPFIHSLKIGCVFDCFCIFG